MSENQNEKINVKEIQITRAEGRTKLCGITRSFDSFKAANSWLLSQSETFPEDGTYDKHDFIVIFEDGDTYTGRLDCKQATYPDNDLDVRQHMIDQCKFYGGFVENCWMGEERYKAYLEEIEEIQPGSQQGYREFYYKYLT